MSDSTTPNSLPPVDRTLIDASCRGPVLWWFVSSAVWLLVGSALALITSFKFSYPDWWSEYSWLTFGRVRPGHLNVVGYGWSSMVAIGASIWMLARLSRVELKYQGLLKIACLLWNLGVALGTIGILMGRGTSVEWLEFSKEAPPLLTLALAIVAAVNLTTFWRRREKHVYVTQWYCMGAMLWMPLLYLTATMICVYGPFPGLVRLSGRGVVQASVNWWFAHNVLGLWVTPIGVGTAYYLIPKIIGRPVHSYYLSIVGFWALALFYSWAGMHHLIGGPLPSWMISASIVGSIMMFVPVVAVGLNHHLTMKGHYGELKRSLSLRFVVFGSAAYVLVSFQGSIESLRKFSEVAHFTHYTVAHAHLGLYGFFSMIMFGAVYYAVPRVTGREWSSRFWISLHFWSSALGILLYFVALSIGGWFQGIELLEPSNKFIEIVINTKPYLMARSIGGSLMTLGHVIFAAVLIKHLLKK